jgi:hypothetical protein
MSMKRWTLTLGAVVLITACVPSAAQEGRNPPEVAVLPDVPLNGDVTETVHLPSGPARDYRALWADPAIKDFVGASENGWDFTKPDGIPGFGSLPYHEGNR